MVGTIASVGDRRHAAHLAIRLLVGATASASILGFVLGVGGEAFALLSHTRLALSALFVLSALALVVDRRHRHVPLPYLHRQVSARGWLPQSYETTAIMWGAQLGVGVLTHLSSSVYYVLLVLAALVGPAGGAILMATFAAARTSQPLVLVLAGRGQRSGQRRIWLPLVPAATAILLIILAVLLVLGNAELMKI